MHSLIYCILERVATCPFHIFDVFGESGKHHLLWQELIETIDFFGRVPKLFSSFSQGLWIAALMK